MNLRKVEVVRWGTKTKCTFHRWVDVLNGHGYGSKVQALIENEKGEMEYCDTPEIRFLTEPDCIIGIELEPEKTKT